MEGKKRHAKPVIKRDKRNGKGRGGGWANNTKLGVTQAVRVMDVTDMIYI